jgi:hypothetical protein
LKFDRIDAHSSWSGKSKSNQAQEDDWKKSNASKSATFVGLLQQQLPLSRIVYLSATGSNLWLFPSQTANINGTCCILLLARTCRLMPLTRKKISDHALPNRGMTGASDPKHFCNLSRLGLWGAGTAFRDHYDFVDEMHKGGIGAMELVGFQSKR